MSRVEMVPKEYGYVVLMVALSGILNLWMGYQVVKARIKYNVRLPRLYALESENKDAKLFNCIQRGHQNTLEWMPLFLAFMAMGGIKHPNLSAAFGLIYGVSISPATLLAIHKNVLLLEFIITWPSWGFFYAPFLAELIFSLHDRSCLLPKTVHGQLVIKFPI